MPDINNKTPLGSLVTAYLQATSACRNKTTTVLSQIEYDILEEKVKCQIQKVANCIGIVPSDEQIESTTACLLEEIIIPPAELEKNADIDASAIRTSAKLREIVIVENHPEKIIAAYLFCRTRTLLKQNAGETEKQYIRLNDRIKKAIDSLLVQKEIFEISEGNYAISHNSEKKYSESQQILKTSTELEAELHKEKCKLKSIILEMLRANYDLNFTIKDLSSKLAERLIDKEVFLDSPNQDGNPSGSNSQLELKIKSSDEITDAKLLADELLEDIKYLSKISTSKTIDQEEMALLAYFAKIHNGYFTDNILTKEQKETLQETECIEKFLNDKRFIGFKKSKMVKRGIAHLRLVNAKDRLKAAMLNLPADAQILFIRKYCAYLESRFKELTGEKK